MKMDTYLHVMGMYLKLLILHNKSKDNDKKKWLIKIDFSILVIIPIIIITFAY